MCILLLIICTCLLFVVGAAPPAALTQHRLTVINFVHETDVINCGAIDESVIDYSTDCPIVLQHDDSPMDADEVGLHAH
jgi:hypothetical protein